MSNPYSSTIEAMIDTLRQLDEDISDALAEMQSLHEEVLRLSDENARLKKKATASSWAGDVDRQGGSFTQDEIERSRNGWY